MLYVNVWRMSASVNYNMLVRPEVASHALAEAKELFTFRLQQYANYARLISRAAALIVGHRVNDNHVVAEPLVIARTGLHQRDIAWNYVLRVNLFGRHNEADGALAKSTRLVADVPLATRYPARIHREAQYVPGQAIVGEVRQGLPNDLCAVETQYNIGMQTADYVHPFELAYTELVQNTQYYARTHPLTGEILVVSDRGQEIAPQYVPYLQN